MRPRLLPALILLPALASACEWDRDTLAEEASLGKDYLATIVGRFPRNPPLYYAMRRDRLLAKRAKSLADYDDLAVADDKLGDPLDALKWIDRKPKAKGMDAYRTHANRGTFLVHAWLAGKRPRSAAQKGLNELNEALRINPDAHFGRERVQIELVKAFLDPENAGFPNSYVGDRAQGLHDAEGYAGIVRLGAGWESPDVFLFLAAALGQAGLGAVGQAAIFRAEELERAGKRSRLHTEDIFPYVEGTQQPGALQDDTRTQYARLRREADAWQDRRTAFMLARLKTGRHPDADPTFWKGWTDAPPPKVETDVVKLKGWGANLSRRVYGGVILALGTCVAIPFGLLLWAFLRWRRSARMKAS